MCRWMAKDIDVDIEVGNSSDLAPDHYNKVNIGKRKSNEIFGFPVNIKVKFILYCSLLNVQ